MMCGLVFVPRRCRPQAAMKKVRVQGEELHHQQPGKRNRSLPLTENKLQMQVWGIKYFMVGFFMEQVSLQK